MLPDPHDVLHETADAVIVGAGPAGLATSYLLKRRGVAHVVLERGDRPAFVWANLYDSLRLHTGRHMSGLPGKRLQGVPLFPTRETFVQYLASYARDFDLPIRTGTEVSKVRRKGKGWALETSNGSVRAKALVMATGLVSNPHIPEFEGRSEYVGQILHSSAYRRPSDLAGKRVLVVGIGNSGAEIASELGGAGYEVEISVRSGANVVPLQIAGIPVQYLSYWVRKLPRPTQLKIANAVQKVSERRRGRSPLPPSAVGVLDAIPLVGFHLVEAVRAGKVRVRPGVAQFTTDGVTFTDGSSTSYDSVILATGFRPTLAPLGNLVQRDSKGFAKRTDRVTSADQPNLWFVGHNYDASGGLANISRDAPLVAERVASALVS